MKYTDLTHIFTDQAPVYPGDPAPALHRIADIGKDGFVDYELKTGMHVGTHMEGPAHMLSGGKMLSDYPSEKFFGRGIIIDARGKTSAGENLLSHVDIHRGDIVLVCFGWSSEFQEEEYYQNYPELSEGFAKKLAESGASIVGLDTPSPDRAPYSTHKILFGRDILIIENLINLAALIGHPNFEVVALPMKLATDAAPCRVVAKVG